MLRTKTETADIVYEEENACVVILPFAGAEITAEEYKKQFEAVHTLTHGKKCVVLIKTAPFLNVTREAREESLKPEREKYIIAQAILVDNLADQIMGNFYIRVQKPGVPTRLFKNEQEARKWLEQKRRLFETNS